MDEKGNIRWGISATGHIAGRFASDIEFAKGACLAGIASREPAKAAAFASLFPAARAYRSFSEMVAAPDIDAVYVASPHAAHLAQAAEAMAAGKPVLVEKPLAAPVEDARALVAKARASGVFAMEAMWSRFLPAVQEARDIIANGKLGRIRRLGAELAWKRPYDPESRFFSPLAGCGAALDLGVYPVSLARFLLGEPDRLEGRWTAAATGVDVSAEFTLYFRDTPAELACGFDRDGDNRLVVEGEKATLVLGTPFIGATRLALFASPVLARWTFPGGHGIAARVIRRLAVALPLPGCEVRTFAFEGTGLQFQIEAASNAIRKGLASENDCRLEDSLATLEIIDRLKSEPPAAEWTVRTPTSV